ncbi:hypothetical protein JKP88DRAFT_217152 [Tribonema minus]|uniref:Uncharacterized protein n=1 Tax=Tribonema minus TaxID=303371 RepID=A0A835ZF90_9STRA|nr:hypothetical protein JKP88DRAFT_217152 [Tribonema minus]
MSNPAVARRASSSQQLVPDGSDNDTTGKLTIGECLRLSKLIADVTELPASCRAYIDKQHAVQKAHDGAGGNMAARATIAKHSTAARGLTHAQLQRRWTTGRDPLKHKK